VAATLLSCAALGAVPVAASAADATIKGTVIGAGLPDPGEGLTIVRAVNAETGQVGGAGYTAGKRDGWSLSAAPGPYAIGLATVPLEGGKLIEKLLAFVEARSGKTEKVKLKIKKKRRHHHAPAARTTARVGEGFGDVDVNHPAIWVHEFDVQSQNPEFGVLRRGMAEMLITDLVAGFAEKDCDAVIVERGRIQDVINEQRLQQLPGFDQGSAVRQGQLIRDNASVTGTLTEVGGQVTITAQYTDRRTGRTRSVSVQGPGASIFDLEQQLAKKLLDAICGELPDTYAGTFDGKLVDSEETMSWSGTVTYERLRPPDPDGEQCEATETACWKSTGGSVTWQVSTTPGADCTYSAGPKTADIPAGLGFISMDPAGGETPGYAGHLGGPDSTANGTEQCPGDEHPRQVEYHLVCCFNTNFGFPWGNYAADSGWHLQGSYMDDGGLSSNWDLSGR
jgi:hypothetical protein